MSSFPSHCMYSIFSLLYPFSFHLCSYNFCNLLSLLLPPFNSVSFLFCFLLLRSYFQLYLSLGGEWSLLRCELWHILKASKTLHEACLRFVLQECIVADSFSMNFSQHFIRTTLVYFYDFSIKVKKQN